MAKLNKPKTAKTSKLREHKDATVNEEGGLAFKMDPKTELYTRVCTALIGEPQFYDKSGEKKDQAILQLVGMIAKEDPEFILQLASFARNEMNLRSVPQVLLVEATGYPESKSFVRKWTASIIQRADELTEVMAYYQTRFGHIGNKAKKGMLCNPLKRGMADAFHQFDAYQLAKYDRDGDVKLKDVLKVVHPKPKNDEQRKLWGMLKERKLPPPETWEVELSVKGATKESWEKAIPKMGYMALLRNLRNFVEKGVNIAPVLKRLTDPEQVKRSKQLPFRFFSAYKALENVPEVRASQKVMDAMQTALELSVDNMPEMKGVTCIMVDTSGSMDTHLSKLGTVSLKQISCLMGAIVQKSCDDAVVGVFADKWAVVKLSKADGILTNMEKLLRRDVGGSTCAWLGMEWLNKNKEKVDRIILLSDQQCYSTDGTYHTFTGGGYGDRGQSLAEQFEQYKAKMNPKCRMYSVDLSGYGTAQFPKDDGSVVELAGFSERLFEFVSRSEANKGDAISAIKTSKPKELRLPKSLFPPVKKEAVDEQESEPGPTG